MTFARIKLLGVLFSVSLGGARGDDGIPQDKVEALRWLGLYALQTGRDPAHFRLGLRYEQGPTDFVRAYMF